MKSIRYRKQIVDIGDKKMPRRGTDWEIFELSAIAVQRGIEEEGNFIVDLRLVCQRVNIRRTAEAVGISRQEIHNWLREGGLKMPRSPFVYETIKSWAALIREMDSKSAAGLTEG